MEGALGEWNIIGASFHADSTEARRPHLVAVWMAFAPAMPPIEPTDWFIHIYIDNYDRVQFHICVCLCVCVCVCTFGTQERDIDLFSFLPLMYFSGGTHWCLLYGILYSCSRPRVDRRWYKLMSIYTSICGCAPYALGFLHFMIYHAVFSGVRGALKAMKARQIDKRYNRRTRNRDSI